MPTGYVSEDYRHAELPETPMTVTDFISAKNKGALSERLTMLLETEAPILREPLIRLIVKSFGVSKSSAVTETIEKTLKSLKVKTSKQKGEIYYWLPGQDSKKYRTVRSDNLRNTSEICQQELKNAICFAVQSKGKMDRDTLIKEASRALGYKKLGNNLESVLLGALQYAKTCGEITIDEDKLYGLNQQETAPEQINDRILYCFGEKYNARGMMNNGRFILLKGSKISPVTTPSCPESVIVAREKYASSIDVNFCVTEDITFGSLSGAASFVAGASRNGTTEWKPE